MADHPTATLLERNARFIASPRGVAIFIGAVLGTLAIFRIVLFPGVGGDDGEQLVFSQFFSWGYQIRNPPLVTWLLIGLQEITGPSVASIVILRTLVLAAIYALTFAITDVLVRDRRLAALAAGSLMLVFYMGWKTIHGFTHTATVSAFYLLSLYLLLRLWETPSRLLGFAFGFTLGLGLLAKYSFLIFALALLGAALGEPKVRRRLASPWILAGFALALPLVVPQAQWLLAHMPENHLVRGEAELNILGNIARVLKGILRLVAGIVGFLLPLWLVWLAVFWQAVRNPPKHEDEALVRLRFFRRLYLLLVVFAIIAIAIIQSDRIRSHYMFILIPLIPAFFLWIGAAVNETQIRRFAAVISLAGVTLVASLIGKYFVEPLVCEHCEDHVPYDAFARQIREAGFTGGTIFAYFHLDPLAGNLRVRFPDARTVSAKHPFIIPPRRHEPGQCLLIWPVVGADEPNTATIRTANESPLKTNLPHDLPWRHRIAAPVPPYGERIHELGYILLDKGAGECR